MEEKEFAPSQKKLKKARKDGKVIHSSELSLGLLMLSFFLLLYLIGPFLYRRLRILFSFEIMSLESPFQAIQPILTPLLILMVSIFLFAYAVNVMQVGFLWAWPKKGKRSFRFFFPVFKLVGLLAIFYIFFKKEGVPRCFTSEQLLIVWAKTLFNLGLALSLYLVILGIFDYIYQKWRFLQQMRMTRSEKKDEDKE